MNDKIIIVMDTVLGFTLKQNKSLVIGKDKSRCQ